MAKLKLGPLPDDKPVRMTISLSAEIHRNLVDYAEIHARETGTTAEPAKLVAAMLDRFMATDRGFSKARKMNPSASV